MEEVAGETAPVKQGDSEAGGGHEPQGAGVPQKLGRALIGVFPNAHQQPAAREG